MVVGMKISYGISKDPKGTPRACRSVQCYVVVKDCQCLSVLCKVSREEESRISDSLIMAHGVAEGLTATDEENCVKMVTKHQQTSSNSSSSSSSSSSVRKTVGVMGSRRIFAPAFKLKVLDSYRNDIDCRGNQRATARKYGIHRRQIQKWLQCEDSLRSSCVDSALPGRASSHGHSSVGNSTVSGAPGSEGPREAAAAAPAPALNLSRARLHGDEELSLPPTHQGPPLRQHCPASPRYTSPRIVAVQNGNNNNNINIINNNNNTSNSNDNAMLSPASNNNTLQQHYLASTTHPEFLGAGLPETSASHETYVSSSRSDERSSYYMANSSYEVDSAVLYDEGSPDVNTYQQASSSRYNRSPVHRYNPHNICHENFPAISATERDIGSQISPAVTIKNEPASLDAVAAVAAAAAPGPCDPRDQPTGRPSSRSALSPLPPRGLSPPHHATTAAVHSEVSRTSPLRTQATRDDGGASGAAEADENSGNANKDGNSVASLRQAIARPHAYPEPQQQQQPGTHTLAQIHHEQLQHQHQHHHHHHVSQTHSHSLGDSECVDPIQPPALPSSAPIQCLSSVRSSPPLEGVFRSGPSSPAQSLPSPHSSRGPLSSGHSTTSSDSDTDALDYSTATTLAPSNDLARRRSFSLRFKLDVLDAFHRDAGVAGNQRATARKFGINRRQVQKWLSQETELRGEIALRGGISRQRLGPLSFADSPIDLRTNTTPADLNDVPQLSPLERTSADPYCCYSPDPVSPHQRQPSHFVSAETSEILLSSTSGPRRCTLSCCADNASCYSQESLRISESTVCSYNRIQTCYAVSSHDSSEMSLVSKRECSALCYDTENMEQIVSSPGSSSPLKRSCTLSCCGYATSPKRLRPHTEDENAAPQDAPLCLVKRKGIPELASQVEPVTSTVPTPPAPPAVPSVPPSVTATKRDAILFKPYLDNPIAKPIEDQVLFNGFTHQYNNNNNCQSVCNLNSNNGAGNRSGEGYALELSLRVPISWGTPAQGLYSDLSQVGSAFVRYPTAPHYT
ncbi:uncharacterized protein LOC124407788 [Diprion similis]|uniref:uncharacterized protein LOC124407788 n=1 Tax=Diprion similis TaxID=362088 RepID=UPI001EF7B2A2|nr:uncharacterized protein LOC124407788 [Diprion similis]